MDYLLLINTNFYQHYKTIGQIFWDRLNGLNIDALQLVEFMRIREMTYQVQENVIYIEPKTMFTLLKELNIQVYEIWQDIDPILFLSSLSYPIAEMPKYFSHKPKILEFVKEENPKNCLVAGNEEVGYVKIPFPTEIFLESILKKYHEVLDRQPDNIKEQFRGINDEIGEYLSSRHQGIKANENRFVNWLMSKTKWPLIKYHMIIWHEVKEQAFENEFFFEYDEPAIKVFDKDLHSYFAYRLKEQKIIENKQELGECNSDSNKIINAKAKNGQVWFWEELLKACQKLQSNITYHADQQKGNNDKEDSRNRFIRDLLSQNGWEIRDQSQQGISWFGQKSGEIDLLLIEHGKPKILIEALNLSLINSTDLNKHIKKLESNYDQLGLAEKYLLVYAEIANNTFESFLQKFKEYLTGHQFEFSRIGEVTEELSDYANIKILKTIHHREGMHVTLHYLLVKMS